MTGSTAVVVTNDNFVVVAVAVIVDKTIDTPADQGEGDEGSKTNKDPLPPSKTRTLSGRRVGMSTCSTGCSSINVHELTLETTCIVVNTLGIRRATIRLREGIINGFNTTANTFRATESCQTVSSGTAGTTGSIRFSHKEREHKGNKEKETHPEKRKFA